MSDANRAQDLNTRAVRAASRSQAAWLVGLLSAAVVLLEFGGEAVRSWLRYDRMAILDSAEYWRFLTAHFVHYSGLHAGMNVAGLGVIALLFPKHYTVLEWLVIGLMSIVAIDLGFVGYEPQIEWYVGLSGVLHGALAAGAIAWWRYESRALALALSLVLMLKLIWEQQYGALPFSGDMPVVVNAHLYGSLGGAVAGALSGFRRPGWSARTRSI